MWILTPGHTGSEEFIPGSSPFPGPVLACAREANGTQDPPKEEKEEETS